jgi:hypothetical protein
MYRDGGGFFKSAKLQIAKHLIRLNIQSAYYAKPSKHLNRLNFYLHSLQLFNFELRTLNVEHFFLFTIHYSQGVTLSPKFLP